MQTKYILKTYFFISLYNDIIPIPSIGFLYNSLISLLIPIPSIGF